MATEPRSSCQQTTEFRLYFASSPCLELIKTSFCSPTVAGELCAVRGKTPRAFGGAVTFQWTAAVHAFSVLFLRAAMQDSGSKDQQSPIIEGGAGSIASSIDAALYKQVGWLELFGSDVRGDTLSKRIILRTNPGRRRAGPVSISLNERVLPKSAIAIFVDGNRVRNPAIIAKHADALESAWHRPHLGIAAAPA